MKFIKKIQGGSSDNIKLVEINKQKFILKTTTPDEIISEKTFQKTLKKEGIPHLEFYENPNLNKNQILLEYIPNSPSLANNFSVENFKNLGLILKNIHQIQYSKSFKYNLKGDKTDYTWQEYLQSKIDKAWQRSSSNQNYGFSQSELKKINIHLEKTLSIKLSRPSLIHGDLHTNNILIRQTSQNSDLILFDKNPLTFNGDPLMDIAILLLDIPHQTIIPGSSSKEDRPFLKALEETYSPNLLQKQNLISYLILMAFSRLHSPYATNYKDIILNLI